MPARGLSCVTVAPPTSELLDLLPKRVKMLIFPYDKWWWWMVGKSVWQGLHRQWLAEHGDKKWPERRAVPLNEDSQSKAFQADLSGWCRVLYENPMFRAWVTKHVSHFCGTNRQLSRIDPIVSNTCPSCGCINEDTSHGQVPIAPGRKTFYNEPDEDLSLHNIHCMLTPSITTTAASRGRFSVTEWEEKLLIYR